MVITTTKETKHIIIHTRSLKGN